MLEHETQSSASQTRPPSAAQTRVTAEEFTAAINSVEQKKASEAARLAGTVEIGQTIEELHIDATAEDILREVESQRARKMTQEQQAAAQRAREGAEARERAAIAAARLKTSAQNAAAVALERFQQREEEKKAQRASGKGRKESRKWPGRGVFKLAALAAVLIALGNHGLLTRAYERVTGGNQPFTIIDDDGSRVSFGPHGISVHDGPPMVSDKTIELSNITDGQVVYSDTAGVKKLLQTGMATDRDTILTHSTAVDKAWPIVRHGDRLYIEGYISPTADNDIGSAPLLIYHDDGALTGNTAKEAVLLPIATGDVNPSSPLLQSIAPVASLDKPPAPTDLSLSHVTPDTHLHDSF